MSDRISRVTTRWSLDPRPRVPRAYRTGEIEVVTVDRDVDGDGNEHWSVRGIPLTSKGTPNGGVDWRPINPEDLEALKARVLG